jgi:hypothetical protein
MKSSNDRPKLARPQRRSFGPLLLGLLILGVIAALAIPFYLGFSNMMQGGTTPQTAQQLAASTPGSQVNVAIEVTNMPSSVLLDGNLLQKNADGTYSRTGKTISVRWSSTKIVMGSSSDIKVGAILQASGILGTNNVLTAAQIVILTASVQLK